MRTIKMFMSLFVGLLLLGLAGTVFADQKDSEAGVDISASQAAMTAAQHSNPQDLNAIDTEAGVFQFNFNSPKTQTDVVASHYRYDQRYLSAIGTEAGTEQLPQSVNLDCSC
jgi:hypothetical protein